jgi:hypothetical protein
MRSNREGDRAKALEIPEVPKTAPAAATVKADKRRRGGHYSYPEARKSDHTDTYWGVQVPDPYQWLEGAGKHSPGQPQGLADLTPVVLFWRMLCRRP